jgi:hypothetical protein
LGPHLEPLEDCLGGEEPTFDAQGTASIPGVGGVIKAQQSQTMFSILYTNEIKKNPKNYF